MPFRHGAAVAVGKALWVLLAVSAVLASVAGCSVRAGSMERADAEARAPGAKGGAFGEGAAPPNLIVIPTDDLRANDLNPNTLERMPNLKKLLVEKGTTFDNAFVTDPVCCPSRATILRGQYAHNHQIIHNQPPLGGAERFRSSGDDDSTVATWLQGSGYRTAFFGKYLNGYAGAYVPPGWDEWSAVSGSFLSNDLSENGRVASYDPERQHLDDVLSGKASAYAERAARPEPPFFTAKRPFFAWLGTKAPHQPAIPAPATSTPTPTSSCPSPPTSTRGTSPTSPTG